VYFFNIYLCTQRFLNDQSLKIYTFFLKKNIQQQQPKDAKFRELVLTNYDRPPPSILPKNIKKLKFLDIDPLEIARQLTLIECKLYNKIQPVECLDKAWSKDEGGDIAANIKAMIVNSNQVNFI
jgi:son of sevenless-like protein